MNHFKIPGDILINRIVCQQFHTSLVPKHVSFKLENCSREHLSSHIPRLFFRTRKNGLGMRLAIFMNIWIQCSQDLYKHSFTSVAMALSVV